MKNKMGWGRLNCYLVKLLVDGIVLLRNNAKANTITQIMKLLILIRSQRPIHGVGCPAFMPADAIKVKVPNTINTMKVVIV